MSKEPKSSNVFQAALQTWTEIDLASLQRKLDDQGLEIKDEQKDLLLSRKNLASKTKEFRKLPDEDKLAEFKGLLKLYQNEIDALTNKQKKVENYFFGFYRLIAEAPDPRPLLELSLDAVVDLGEVSGLRKEIDQLKEELSKKADYDQLKQRLLQTEQKSAEVLSTKLAAKDNELQAVLDEKESNWRKKQADLESQIASYKHNIEELRTSKEVTELQLNSQTKQLGDGGKASASLLAELDIVSRDAESSKKRVLELEKRNEALRSELLKVQNSDERQHLEDEYSRKVSELEGENALLVANVNRTRDALDASTKDNNAKVELLNREIGNLTTEIKKLKLRLDATSDYDEVKHELHLLRQIEFGEDDGDAASPQIDALLVERNKSLTKELASFRAQQDELHEKIAALESQLTTTQLSLEKAQHLNRKLEADLAGVQDSGKFNDNASMISGFSRATTRPGADELSILPIITKQRDRFRDRNNELEDEVRKQVAVISDLKRQMNALTKDNEQLYERTRYLASFKGNAGLVGPVASQLFGSRTSNRKLLQTTSPSLDVDLESNQYQQAYEQRLHPIEQFRIREQERISSKLSPIERLFILVTRAILATRTTRMLFMGYCLGLHAVVMFVTIYAMSIHTTLVPEVGLNTSTGGLATGAAGSPDVVKNLAEG